MILYILFHHRISARSNQGHLTFNNPAVQGTFVGVYDGHGGPEGSRFIADNLFPNLKKFAFEGGEVSEEVMRNAFAETDEDFLS
ncbi:BnaA10g11720D [Brassica napus]|uniref:protein-serine/threonine phosphatase n=1 Tax=Brassica napus TaxID=3708 RepID=A0A078IMR5_BRANA|nr:BnaA10g11720D [Brassica napus]